MRPVAEPKPVRAPAPQSPAQTPAPVHAAHAPPPAAPGSFRHRAHAIGHALSRQPHLQAIRDGVVGALPIILLGSGFLLLWQPPWPGLSRFLPPQSALRAGYLACAGLVSIYACAAMLPATVCVVVVWLLVHVLGVDLVGGITALFRPLVRGGDTFAAVLVVVLIDSALWMVGVHGLAVLAAVRPLWLSALAENMA